ncbi:hypothetical protein [Phormidesmis priestleyi]|uniref:hypothetical protein n=1 Tax=Phormidesmis priestleyi TaxID=268141 RepID=UPI0011606638|nr:hypothetical protein [Phormidesmis priestleyi]
MSNTASSILKASRKTFWMQLQCPSYVMLCNFDEFWIYDFRKQSEEPIEKISLTSVRVNHCLPSD